VPVFADKVRLSTVSPSRTNASSASSCGRCVSLPDDMSMNVRSHLEVLKLPVRVLIETAHPQVTDPLPSHPPTPDCQVEICDPRGQHVNQYGTRSNLTRRRALPDVRLGYTPA
jgi:hypothetical protein